MFSQSSFFEVRLMKARAKGVSKQVPGQHFKGQGCRSRGGPCPPPFQILEDQLTLSQQVVGQIMSTTLLLATPGFSDLPTTLKAAEKQRFIALVTNH